MSVDPLGGTGGVPPAGGAGFTIAAGGGGQPMVNSGKYNSLAGGGGNAANSAGTPQMVAASQYDSYPDKLFYNPDHTEWNSLVSRVKASGVKTNGSLSSIKAAWQGVLLGASYNTQYSPDEYLTFAAQTRAFAGAQGTGAGTYNGPVSHTVFTDKFDAKKIVNDALGAYLGTDATPKQLEAFYKQLHDVEAANPTVVTPHGKAAATQTGGSNAGQVAIDFAKSQDNYAETQAATTLTSWLQDNITKANQERII